MTGNPSEASGAPAADADAVRPKAPAPDLATRARPPAAVRLRKSVVQGVVLCGAALVAGSLAWAFVVQPALRESARDRAVEAREDQAGGAVRPSERVTDQPASYDRLPDPRRSSETTRDDGTAGAAPAATPPQSGGGARTQAPETPDPEAMAARSSLFFEIAPAAGPAAGRTGTGAAPSGGRPEAIAEATGYNPHGLTAPLSPYELKAGAIIPAALLTAVDTARGGPVVAAVSQDVYDTVSGRHLVIPQGARLIGRHEGNSAYGDRRAFLTWERLILPNGRSLILAGEPGVDDQGAVGVEGTVDRR
ncbi:MAG: TrbI/VirB10 family protein, partial [Brevundimonas sp.]